MDDKDLPPLDPEPGADLESGSRRSRIIIYGSAFLLCLAAIAYWLFSGEEEPSGYYSAPGFFILAPVGAIGFLVLVIRAVRERR